jgi:GcrA cell cycle regulator
MEPSNWAPEHSGALREYLALGMTYSEIARAINAKFNTHYTRSAALSRARRIGLVSTERPADLTAPAAQQHQQPSLSQLRKASAAALRWLVPNFEREEAPKLRCVDVEPRLVSLIELEAGDCRYPYGGDEEGEAITFCGHPRREDSSYRTAHFRLTRGPGAAPERALSTASLRVVEAA